MTGVCAVMLVKDEGDIIERNIRWLLTQVDKIIVSDNMSTDGTFQILSRLREETDGLVEVHGDEEVGYYQSAKTTRLAMLALEYGFEWVVPVDADELWYSPFGRLADELTALDPMFSFAEAALYNHIATASDPTIEEEPDPVRRIGWRQREPARLCKVACRTRPDLVIEQGNHRARVTGSERALPAGHFVIRHFPYRSPEQFVSKAVNGAAAYAAAPGLPLGMGDHWRGYGRMIEESGEEAGHAWFYKWFWNVEPESDETMIYDPSPTPLLDLAV